MAEPRRASNPLLNPALAVLATLVVVIWGLAFGGWGSGGLGADDHLVATGPRKLGGMPEGLGMWTWMRAETEDGDVDRIIARARGAGLTHLYIRTGDSRRGFYGGDFLDDLLPVAHEAGLRVYGWDFPDLTDVTEDVERAVEAIEHEAPGGHRIDGFSADIETRAEGTALTATAAREYSERLRSAVGPDEVLIATVPNPTEHFQRVFPYEAVVPAFDAVAPMVYWHARDPAADMARAAAYLEPFGKVLLPIGQAYDGEPEGGPPGPPPPEEINAFLDAAVRAGAPAVSFWSWQHASAQIWATLAAREWSSPAQ